MNARRKRSLTDLFNKYQSTKPYHKKYMAWWKDWFQRSLPIGEFYGYKGSSRLLVRCLDYGVSTNAHPTEDQPLPHNTHPSDLTILARMHSNIPLLLNNPVWDRVQTTLEGLLNGTIKPIPHNQTLMEEYETLQNRWNHVRAFQYWVKHLIELVVEKEFGEILRNAKSPTELLVLKHGRKRYYFKRTGEGIKMIDDYEEKELPKNLVYEGNPQPIVSLLPSDSMYRKPKA